MRTLIAIAIVFSAMLPACAIEPVVADADSGVVFVDTSDTSDVTEVPDSPSSPDAGMPDVPDSSVPADTSPPDAGTDAGMPADSGTDSGGADAPAPVDAGTDAATPVTTNVAVVTEARCGLLVTGEFFCWHHGSASSPALVTWTDVTDGVDAVGRCVRRAGGSVACVDAVIPRVTSVTTTTISDVGAGYIARYSTRERGAVWNPTTGTQYMWSETSTWVVTSCSQGAPTGTNGDDSPVVVVNTAGCPVSGRTVRVGLNAPGQAFGRVREIGRSDGSYVIVSEDASGALSPARPRCDLSALRLENSCAGEVGDHLIWEDADVGELQGPWNLQTVDAAWGNTSPMLCYTTGRDQVSCSEYNAFGARLGATYVVNL